MFIKTNLKEALLKLNEQWHWGTVFGKHTYCCWNSFWDAYERVTLTIAPNSPVHSNIVIHFAIGLFEQCCAIVSKTFLAAINTLILNVYSNCQCVYYQIYPGGIRHIRADKRVNEWKTPGKKNIVKCAVNRRQVSYN